MYNTRSRSWVQRRPRVTGFEGTDTLEFTAEEERAIRAAERAQGFRPQQNEQPEISLGGAAARLIALILGLIVLEQLAVALIIGIPGVLSPSSAAQSETQAAQAPLQLTWNTIGPAEESIGDLPLPTIAPTRIMPEIEPQAETVLQAQTEAEPASRDGVEAGSEYKEENVSSVEPKDKQQFERAEETMEASGEKEEQLEPERKVEEEPSVERCGPSPPRPTARRPRARSFFRGIGKGLEWLLEDMNGVVVVSQPWPSRRH